VVPWFYNREPALGLAALLGISFYVLLYGWIRLWDQLGKWATAFARRRPAEWVERWNAVLSAALVVWAGIGLAGMAVIFGYIWLVDRLKFG
jgi:hypothetical protein